MWMVERGRGLRLLHEALLASRICSGIVWEEFERDAAVKMTVAGLIDHAHAAFTELSSDGIVCEHFSRHGGAGVHRYPSILPLCSANVWLKLRDRQDALLHP